MAYQETKTIAQEIRAKVEPHAPLEQQRRAYAEVCHFDPETFFCKFNEARPNELTFVKQPNGEVIPCCQPRKDTDVETAQETRASLVERLKRMLKRVNDFYVVVDKAYVDYLRASPEIILNPEDLAFLKEAETVLRDNMAIATKDIEVCKLNLFSQNLSVLEHLPPEACEPMEQVLGKLEEALYPALIRIEWVIGRGRANAQNKRIEHAVRQTQGYAKWFWQGTKAIFTRLLQHLQTAYEWTIWALGLLWTHGMPAIRALLRFYRNRKTDVVTFMATACANSNNDKQLLYYAYQKGYTKWKLQLSPKSKYNAIIANSMRALTGKSMENKTRYLHRSVKEILTNLRDAANKPSKKRIVSKQDIDIALLQINPFLEEDSNSSAGVLIATWDVNELAKWVWILKVWVYDKLNILTRGLCFAVDFREWSRVLQIDRAEAEKIVNETRKVEEKNETEWSKKGTTEQKTQAATEQKVGATESREDVANNNVISEEALPELVESNPFKPPQPPPEVKNVADAREELQKAKTQIEDETADALMRTLPELEVDASPTLPSKEEVPLADNFDNTKTDLVSSMLFKLYWMFYRTNVIPTSDIDDDMEKNYGKYNKPTSTDPLTLRELPKLQPTNTELHHVPHYVRYAFCRAQMQSDEACQKIATSTETIDATTSKEAQYREFLEQQKQIYLQNRETQEAKLRQEELQKLVQSEAQVRAKIESAIQSSKTLPPTQLVQPLVPETPVVITRGTTVAPPLPVSQPKPTAVTVAPKPAPVVAPKPASAVVAPKPAPVVAPKPAPVVAPKPVAKPPVAAKPIVPATKPAPTFAPAAVPAKPPTNTRKKPATTALVPLKRR